MRLNEIFSTFHSHLRNEIFYDPSSHSTILKRKPELQQNISYDLGWTLQVKESTVEHPQVRNGVFLRLKHYGKISRGTIIGFVPGMYFNHITDEYDAQVISRPIVVPFMIGKEAIYPNPFICTLKTEEMKR